MNPPAGNHLSDEDDRIASLRAGLNYAVDFEAACESYSEADPDGRLIIHPGRPA